MKTVFGLDCGDVIADDEVALEVVGCVKYLDAEGRVEHLPFRSSGITAPEAYGMIRMTQILLTDELDTSMYMVMTLEDDDDE